MSKVKSYGWMFNYEVLLLAIQDYRKEVTNPRLRQRQDTLHLWVNDELVERIERDYGRKLSKKQVHVAMHNLIRNGDIQIVKRGLYEIALV